MQKLTEKRRGHYMHSRVGASCTRRIDGNSTAYSDILNTVRHFQYRVAQSSLHTAERQTAGRAPEPR